jgi:hypothetical protein
MRCSPTTRQVKAGLFDELGVYLNFNPSTESCREQVTRAEEL